MVFCLPSVRRIKTFVAHDLTDSESWSTPALMPELIEVQPSQQLASGFPWYVLQHAKEERVFVTAEEDEP